jgi:hypothetical protein
MQVAGKLVCVLNDAIRHRDVRLGSALETGRLIADFAE